jgi:hypothetical protein
VELQWLISESEKVYSPADGKKKVSANLLQMWRNSARRERMK